MNEKRGLQFGVVLVGVGAFLLLRRTLDISGPGPILLLIGAILFMFSALRRLRGPLLPACLLIGLGAGFLLRDPLARWLPEPATLMLGLGCGFLAVAVLDVYANHVRGPGPRVAGFILVGLAAVSGLSHRFDLAAALERIEPYWPWLLVAVGAALVAASFRKRGRPA
ncbi:MAG: hypothetical protein ACRD00_05335 [Thermoanaerobaculia bacterium]